MSAVAKGFNPLVYSMEMKGVGMAPEMAERQANLLNDAFSVNKEEAASKKDLEASEKSLRQELQIVEMGLKKDIAGIRSELKQDIAEVRSELKQDIAVVRQEMRSMENRLIVAMAKIVFGGFSMFGLIVIGLHYFRVMV